MQPAAVSRAILDIAQRLAAHIPRSQRVVQALVNEPNLTPERTSQALLDVWQVSLDSFFFFLSSGSSYLQEVAGCFFAPVIC